MFIFDVLKYKFEQYYQSGDTGGHNVTSCYWLIGIFCASVFYIPLFYANDEKDALFLSLKKDPHDHTQNFRVTLDLRVAQPTTGKVINLLDCETCFKHFYTQKMYTAKKILVLLKHCG